MTTRIQFGLDFDGRLPVSAQEGMQRADENADPRWQREMDAAIRQVALTNDTFTADEVVAELERNKFHFTTHNNAALGPRLLEVSKNLKWMRCGDGFRRSKRPAAHGNLLRIWQSNIYTEGA